MTGPRRRGPRNVATNAKMLRLGKLQAIQPIAALARRWLAKDPVVDLNHRPPRMARLRSFLFGFRTGLSASLDAHGHFLPEESNTGRKAP